MPIARSVGSLPATAARRLLASLLLAVLAVPPLVAAEPAPRAPTGRAVPATSDRERMVVSAVDEAPSGDLAPGARIVQAGEPLRLSEAVALAIRNGLDVEVERFAPMIAQSNAEESWGAYDPFLFAQMGYDVNKTPNTFTLNNANLNRDRFKGGSVGVTQLVPLIGATVGVEYAASSTSTRSSIQAFDDQFNSSVFLTASIPLARGLIWGREWTNVKSADRAYAASREAFRREVMNVVRATVNAYWSLVSERDRVRVAQKSLETARALIDQTKTQFEVGVVSRVEVVEAEAGVANREFDLISAANAYRNAQDRLIDVVLGPEFGALTDIEFAPIDAPDDFVVRQVDVGETVRQAFANRPELAEFDQLIEQAQLELRFAKNQRLPQFDAELAFGYVGVSGEPNTDLSFGTPPPSAPFDASDDDFFDNDGADNYSVRGVFSIPFPNTVGRKRVVQRKLELQRAKTRRSRLEQQIIVEVRAAVRTLFASAQGIEAAERRRLAAEEQLRAERIRLEHGESTPFKVLEKEEDLVEAESQKIGALQTYRAAEVGLDRARGTILETHGVLIDEIDGID